MNADLLHGFYLRDLLVEPVKGRVGGREGSAHLPPRGMEVLLRLAARPGELVTRESLLEEVWGVGKGSHEALSHAVSEIRHALGDRKDQPVFIQTLPKRGYRLLVTPELASQSTSTIVIGADGGARVSDLSLFENLKQRGVLETAIAYLILGWLIIQVVDIVFEHLLFPQWAGTFVTVLVIAGFPIAVALSWFLEFRDGRAIVDTLSPSDARRRRFSRTYLSVISAFAIAAVIVFVYDRSIGLPEAEPPSIDAVVSAFDLPPVLENSIAVLPFLNIDGSRATQVFANGLVDDVITRLARVPGLLVSARGDSHTLEPNTASQRVRERLRVAMYLEGSVQVIGGELRVIVQLIDSETGFHKLSRSFDRPLEDFFDIRDEITEITVANVRAALPDETQKGPVFLAADSSLDAYLLYRRGVDASRDPSLGSMTRAIEYYDAALEVDPGYAVAHAGKCTAYIAKYVEQGDERAVDNARAACATALELNPNLDAVHVAMGNLHQSTGAYEAAMTAFELALASNPDNVSALSGTADLYMQMQEIDKAEAILQRTVGLEPGNWAAYNNLGAFYFNLGRYAEAAEQYEVVVALDSANMIGLSNLAMSLVYAGEFERAVPVLEDVAATEPRAITYSNLGLTYYYLGRLDAAIAAHTKATELAPKDHVSWSGLGDALWIAGHEADAIAAYREAEALAAGALQVNPTDAYTQLDLAWINAMLGRPEDAQRYLERAEVLASMDPVFNYVDALIHVRDRRPDEAITALEAAIDSGFSSRTLAVEPFLSPLHGHARFETLVSESY